MSGNHLKREIGLIGLTFIGVGGVLGSGWLFAPLLAAKETGGSAILAWLIGAIFMMLLALTFAEISSMLPVAGGIATVPLLSHGRAYSMLVGWSAWTSYCIAAPIEVELMLSYLDYSIPWIFTGRGTGHLTFWGWLTAVGLLGVMVVLNAFGVALFTRINNTITWFKIAIPLIVSGVLIATQFTTENFTAHGGFMPNGIDGVLTAVSTGGVIFSYLGFRHIIDLAGEAKRPQFTIPAALVLTLIICFIVYFVVQVAFIGALTPAELSAGWAKLHFSSDFGPLGAIAAGVGIMWLVSLLNISAVISPFGGAFIQMGGNARLVLAMSYNGFFPRLFQRLSLRGVPMRAHFLNFAMAGLIFSTLSLSEMAAIVSALLILSFAAGPVALVTMRRLASELPRSFKLPWGNVLAPIAFFITTLTIYWSGWNTMWHLLIALAIGVPLIAYRLSTFPKHERDLRPIFWLLPYLAGLALLSRFGQFGGGTGDLPKGLDLLAAAILSALAFWRAMATSLGKDRFAEVLVEVQTEIRDEEGDGEGKPA